MAFPRMVAGASEDATEAGRAQVRFMGISQIDFTAFHNLIWAGNNTIPKDGPAFSIGIRNCIFVATLHSILFVHRMKGIFMCLAIPMLDHKK